MAEVTSALSPDAATSVPFRWGATTSAQRRTLLAAGLGWMLDAFSIMLYSLVLTTLMREFAMSKGYSGLNGRSLTLVASAIGRLIFGLLADRYGRRRMLRLSILTYSLSTCGFTATIFSLALCRFLLGWAWAGLEFGSHVGGNRKRGHRHGAGIKSYKAVEPVGCLAAVVAQWLSRTNWRWFLRRRDTGSPCFSSAGCTGT